MAVFYDATGQGDAGWTDFGDAVSENYTHTANAGDTAVIVGVAFTAADLTLGPFVIGDNDLSDLTRTVTYGGAAMTSVGVIQWGTTQGWTEVFVLVGIPNGPSTVQVTVRGGAPSKRLLRVGSVSYGGVYGIGTPVTASGTGTAITASSTATVAEKIVAVVGARGGLTDFSGDQRYSQSASIGLLMGDASGTGSSQALNATRQKSGPWGVILIPLLAADTIATCDPLIIEPFIGDPVIHREPRPGGLRRQVFTVPVDE